MILNKYKNNVIPLYINKYTRILKIVCNAQKNRFKIIRRYFISQFKKKHELYVFEFVYVFATRPVRGVYSKLSTRQLFS